MSPRRKYGLSKEDLEALKHLPAVLRALEHLQEQHAKVRALVGGIGGHGIGMDFRAGQVTATRDAGGLVTVGGPASGLTLPEAFRPDPRALSRPQAGSACLMWDERPCVLCGRSEGPHHEGPETCRGYSPPPTIITLDTPERQEFERARKAGVPVPPPDLANISEAQRERMAEQKALVALERAAKGRPPGGYPAMTGQMAADEGIDNGAPVREEELPTSPNGSAGVEMQSGGFIDG